MLKLVRKSTIRPFFYLLYFIHVALPCLVGRVLTSSRFIGFKFQGQGSMFNV